MTSLAKSEKIKNALRSLPGFALTGSVEIEKCFITRLSIATDSAGALSACRLEVNDAPALFEFYTKGLSEKPKKMFAPYPLFHTPPKSAEELAKRITDWQKEDDWTAISLFKEKKIIGFGLLKRFRSPQATSAIVIRDDYLQKGLGCLVQCIIVEQARLLNIPGFHIKVVSDNYASIRLHEKCGFKQTKNIPPSLYEEIFQYLNKEDKRNGKKAIKRHLIEMTIDLSRNQYND
jgi:RimJ/RimL family protein N-acetyltransferase